MERVEAKAIIGKLREEIRRRETALPAGSSGALPSGFDALDALLPGGGFPQGRVVELTGARASGKTTLALAALAQATRAGKLVAFVDTAHELYPPAARALGAELSRLLIVRPPDGAMAVRVASLLARSKAFAAVVADLPQPCRGPLGPLSRRLLEAAEMGRAAIVLLSDGPSGLDASLRLRVERAGETELSLTVERSRMGPPGRARRAKLPSPDEPEADDAALFAPGLAQQPAANDAPRGSFASRAPRADPEARSLNPLRTPAASTGSRIDGAAGPAA